MKKYTIFFYQDGAYQETKESSIFANNKEEAYKRFMDDNNWSIYSAWVHSVMYQNGKIKYFNNFSGKPY